MNAKKYEPTIWSNWKQIPIATLTLNRDPNQYMWGKGIDQNV